MHYRRARPNVSAADIYYQNAASERLAASKQDLPNRRQQHERSAERWEDMARGAEETERRSRINEEEKRASR
jgi:hypothetical protein